LARTFLFLVEPGREWIGGVYYVRNVLSTLSRAPWFRESRIHVLVRPEFRDLFESLRTAVPVLTLHERRSAKPRLERLASMVLRRGDRIYDRQVAKVSTDIGASLVFPVTSLRYAGIGATQAHWIPDFQHLHLPEFFPDTELRKRDRLHAAIARGSSPLVLSSRSALADWERAHPVTNIATWVLPFVSDIEAEIRQLDEPTRMDLLGKSGLRTTDGGVVDYLYVPNQFWQHKNHALILDALDVLREAGKPLPTIVCTGSTADHRSREHAARLALRVRESGYESNFRVLSMVGRLQQLSIMWHARSVLQPSLFEGWNTGVQEALRLGRPLLMSDLPVHREQCPDGARFFDPKSAARLAELMASPIDGPSSDVGMLESACDKAALGFAEGVRRLLCP
jgi:hypothetical protein